MFRGSVVSLGTKPVRITGGHADSGGILYAPRGKVEVTGSGFWRGAIVASQLRVSGGGGHRVVFDDSLNFSLPGEIFDQGSSGDIAFSRSFWSEI